MEGLLKIYTRTGDSGRTALFGGERVSKDHVRVEAYGTVDELNAVLGRALLDVADSGIRDRLGRVQQDLFAVGAALARTSDAKPGPRLPVERVEQMEGWIDAAAEELEPLRSFIVPGGGAGAAALHQARTVCRRAERRVVRLAATTDVDEGILRYLNRLSDVLFAFARLENHRAGRADVVWRSGRESRDGE